jgi:hypothetical protein
MVSIVTDPFSSISLARRSKSNGTGPWDGRGGLEAGLERQQAGMFSVKNSQTAIIASIHQ